MMLKSQYMTTVIVMMLSILLLISAKSYWSLWLLLEIYGFILMPWLMEGESKNMKVKIFTYFYIQSISSIMFMLSLLYFSKVLWLFKLIMLISLSLKMGSFPFYQWMFNMVENLSWTKFFFFSSFVKMWSLVSVQLVCSFSFMIWVLSLSNMITALAGVTSYSMRYIMTYSSLSHLGWMMMSMYSNKMLLVFYTLVYFTSLYMFCFLMSKSNISNLNSLSMLYMNEYWLLMIFLLSIAGIPPFVGFFPKIMLMKWMMVVGNMGWMMSWVIYTLSLIPLYFYIKILYLMMLFHSKTYKTMEFMMKKSKKNFFFSMLMFFLFSVMFVIGFNSLWVFN